MIQCRCIVSSLNGAIFIALNEHTNDIKTSEKFDLEKVNQKLRLTDAPEAGFL